MRRFGTYAFALVSLVSGGARADDAAPDKARALYQDGARLYNLGQYEDAVRAFEEAYALSGAKPLLFNIAQAHRLAGPSHCERALRAYESYLREDKAPSNESEVDERIVEMRACAERVREDEEKAALDARPAAPVPPPAPAPHPSRAPIVLAISGASLVVVGAGLYAAARIKYQNERGNCPCAEGTFATWQTLTTTSYVLLAAGGAAATAGVSWWFVSRPRAPSYAISAGPAGVQLTGTF